MVLDGMLSAMPMAMIIAIAAMMMPWRCRRLGVFVVSLHSSIGSPLFFSTKSLHPAYPVYRANADSVEGRGVVVRLS